MDSRAAGALVLAVCALLFAAAFALHRRQRAGWALAAIVLGGLLLRAHAGADHFLHAWDERYHALVAKNLMRHPLLPTLYDDPVLPYDYRDWSSNHVWVHKQPLPLWGMAASMRLFGVNEKAVRLPSLLLSTVAIAMTFAIGSHLFSPVVGLAAAFLHAVDGPLIQAAAGRAATDHTDVFHLFFVELAVLLAVLHSRSGKRRFAPLIGLALGLAVLCKWLTALIVLPLWVILVWKKRPPPQIAIDFLIIAVVCAGTFLPWQIYIHLKFPLESRWESAYNLIHLVEPVEGHGGSALFYFHVLRAYGELVFLPLGWFLYRTVRGPGDARFLLPTLWLIVPLGFFTLVQTKMNAYLLFAMPALFVMVGAFWEAARGIAWRGLSRAVLSVVLFLVVVGPVVHTVRETGLLERRDRTNKWAVALRRLAKQVPDSRAVFFNAPPIETMFYTAGIAYAGFPTREQVADLRTRGYAVYVLDAGKVPSEMRQDPAFTFMVP